jgi:hypothetical protein
MLTFKCKECDWARENDEPCILSVKDTTVKPDYCPFEQYEVKWEKVRENKRGKSEKTS